MKLYDLTIVRQRSDWDTEPMTTIRFRPERDVAMTVEYDDGITIEFDASGDIVTIKVLGNFS